MKKKKTGNAIECITRWLFQGTLLEYALVG